MKIKAKKRSKGIVSWPKDDRPREKLLRNGEHSLSNSELLAILLRTGTTGESAIDLARRILQKFRTFSNMSHTDKRDWREFKGLGSAKIAQLKAAFEISRRFNIQEGRGNYPILGMGNITYDGQLDLTKLSYVELPKSEFNKIKLQLGDVIFNRTNSTELVGKTTYWNQNFDAVIASYLESVHKLSFFIFVMPEVLNRASRTY